MPPLIVRHFCFSTQVYGDKDADGFYWGELRGRRGYVPHNMVTEVDDGTGQMGQMPQQPGGAGQVMPGQVGTQQSMRNVSRDRWGDIYANMPVKRMIALYDYDPQELSPNVDAEVSIPLNCPVVLVNLSCMYIYVFHQRKATSTGGGGLFGAIFDSIMPTFTQDVARRDVSLIISLHM